MKVYISPSTKDINGYSIPLCFYEKPIKVKKQKKDTVILQCDKIKVEVMSYYITIKED